MRTAVCCWLALACLSTAARGQEPPPAAAPEPWVPRPDSRPAYETLLAPGMAPAAIHFNAVGFPLAAGTPLTAQYEWDFGDPAGRFNQLPGFAAGHLYNASGTYAVTLTVTDEAGHRSVARGSVTIAADTRRALYVSQDGSDANGGSTEADPLHSAAAAFDRLQGTRKSGPPGHTVILFRAGGTYPVTDTLNVRGTDLVIGRYGPAAAEKPVILMERSEPDAKGRRRHGNLSIDGRCDGVTIEHLTFATPYAVPAAAEAPKVGIEAVTGRGRNLALVGCSFHAIDTGIDAIGNPVGLLVQDCDAPGLTDLRGFLIWGQGADHAYLGNLVANSTREHCVRTTNLTRVLIYGNDFTNVDRAPVDKSDGIKGCIEFHEGSFAYIAANRCRLGPVRAGPRGGPTERASTTSDWCVFDGNDLDDAQVRIDPGSHHIMVRNNVVRRPRGAFVEVDAPDSAGRFSSDLTIAHNTGLDTGEGGTFLKVWGRVDGLAVADNLFVAPRLRAGPDGASSVNVNADDLGWFTAMSHNVWAVPATYAGPAPGTACVLGTDRDRNKNYRSPADWSAVAKVSGDRFAKDVAVDARGVPAAGTPADGAAPPVPGTAFDHDGHPRPPDGPATAGAFQIAPAGRGTVPASSPPPRR